MSGGPDMLQQMMQQMMAPGPPGSPDSGLGIGGMFPSLSQGNPAAFGQTPPASTTTTPPPKTLLDRLFPLVHLLSMIALAIYAVGWLEPARKFGLYGWMGVGGSVDWAAWGALSRRRPATDVLDTVGQLSGVGLAEVVRLLVVM